jgi:serine/threonine protein kinase
LTVTLAAGRYRIERELGRGGMATVYLAHDTELDRLVAIKLLAQHLATEDEFLARFLREARLAGRLSHPNVVRVYDAGDADGRPFIVMECVRGGSLAEASSLSATRVVRLGTQACAGLQHAHDTGLVHRDIKPANLLVRDDGVLKIADFGIARAAESTRHTQVGTLLGTAAYLAPEQVAGAEATPGSDVYALGAVLYELLTGRTPYTFDSLAGQRHDHAGARPRAVRSTRTGSGRDARACARAALPALRASKACVVLGRRRGGRFGDCRCSGDGVFWRRRRELTADGAHAGGTPRTRCDCSRASTQPRALAPNTFPLERLDLLGHLVGLGAERDALARERQLNVLARLVDPPLDRGKRDLERVRDLCVGKTDDVAEQQRHLQVDIEALDRTPDGIDRLQTLHRCVDDLERRDVLERHDRARPAFRRTQLVEHTVLRHLEQPGRELRPRRETRQTLEDPEEDLLSQILRQRPVTDEPQDVVVNRDLIGADDE